MYLARKGHEVAGADLFSRRAWVEEIGGWSATPIRSMHERLEAFKEVFGESIEFFEGDFCDPGFVYRCFKEFRPDAIVHLGEQPSAPYSMMDLAHSSFTQANNVQGNLNILYAMRDVCPEAHLVKLGTMGEYGTPNIDIEEGFITINHKGRTDTLPFPKQVRADTTFLLEHCLLPTVPNNPGLLVHLACCYINKDLYNSWPSAQYDTAVKASAVMVMLVMVKLVK